jgi:hypothetical protein
MKCRRNLVGWLVILLGSLGVLLSVAALVGVWVLSIRITRSVDQAASGMIGFTETVSQRAGLASESVRESRRKVEEIQLRVEMSLEGQGIDPVKLREGLAELQAYVDEFNRWIELAGSTRDFVAVLDGVLGSVEGMAGAEGRGEVAAAVAGGATKVKEASGALAEIRGALEKIQTSAEQPETSAKAIPLLTQFAGTLDKFESSIEGFAGSIDAAGVAVEKLRDEVCFKINLGAWVASFLLVWNGVAQACLVGWGRRFLGRADRGNN